MADEWIRLHPANCVVLLVCVLLQALFACFSCLSFELDAKLSMERLKINSRTASQQLCPTHSEAFTNGSWLNARSP
jgi:hypothetical protein